MTAIKAVWVREGAGWAKIWDKEEAMKEEIKNGAGFPPPLTVYPNGYGSGIINAAHLRSQHDLNRLAEGMLNDLSPDQRVLSLVEQVRAGLQDLTMCERRVHRSNIEIATGQGDSVHLMRVRTKLLKALHELAHLTGNDRIHEWRTACLKYLDALENRREHASKYRHGQCDRVWMVAAEREIDRLLTRLLDFVADDFGERPKVKPRRGILRSLFERTPKDPADWYKVYTSYPGPK